MTLRTFKCWCRMMASSILLQHVLMEIFFQNLWMRSLLLEKLIPMWSLSWQIKMHDGLLISSSSLLNQELNQEILNYLTKKYAVIVLLQHLPCATMNIQIIRLIIISATKRIVAATRPTALIIRAKRRNVCFVSINPLRAGI